VAPEIDLRRGLDRRLQPGVRPALIVVDFVKAYVLERSPLYAAVESAQLACQKLLESARRAGIPILHTTVRYQAEGRDGGIFFRKVPALRVFLDGVDQELTQFATGLEPQPGELVLTKQYASAFFGTSLAATLSAAGIDTLLIAGVSTSGCIRATAVDACQHGFIPIVVREAVGDRPGGTHEANLFDLQVKYAEVRPLAEVQHYLARDVTCHR
jgi:maleamate amidohydrolase